MPYVPKSSPVEGGDTGLTSQYNNLRDDALEVAHTILSGLDINKPASPTVGDVYYATDTIKTYICKVINVWATLFPAGYMVSDNLLISADTERSTKSGSYVKVKEIKVPAGSNLRIKFDLKGSGADHIYAYGQIYKNGLAIGTEQTRFEGSYTTFSEDIAGFGAGDLIQLYIRTGNTLVYAYAKNFRIYADIISDITVVTN